VTRLFDEFASLYLVLDPKAHLPDAELIAAFFNFSQRGMPAMTMCMWQSLLERMVKERLPCVTRGGFTCTENPLVCSFFLGLRLRSFPRVAADTTLSNTVFALNVWGCTCADGVVKTNSTCCVVTLVPPRMEH
jgi:hypothetical protein